MTAFKSKEPIATAVDGESSTGQAQTSRIVIEAKTTLGIASGGAKKRKGEELTMEDIVSDANEEEMEENGCNEDDDSNSDIWEFPNYYRKKTQRKNRRDRPQQQQNRPRYTVIVKPTAAERITNVDSWLLWSTFRKFLTSPCENDQIGYTINYRNNVIAINVQTEQHALDLMALKELPTEDTNKKIPVTVYRATTGSQPRGVIHGVSPGDAARGIVENAIAENHDIVHARPIGKNGTYLVTFEGEGIPRSLRLFGRYHNVFSYKPTAVICLQCHGLGHKATVCTRKQRCKMCGEAHPDNQPCQGKYCPNCRKTGHTVFETEACRARNRADDKLQKRAAVGLRNHGNGTAAIPAKGRAVAQAVYTASDFPPLEPQQQQQHQHQQHWQQQQPQQRKPQLTYIQPKAKNTDHKTHADTSNGSSGTLATELAQLRESSNRILEKIQQLEVKYENQLRMEQEGARRAKANVKAEADRKGKQEAEQRRRAAQQKTKEARSQAQRCPVTYEQVLEKKRKEAEVAAAKNKSTSDATVAAAPPKSHQQSPMQDTSLSQHRPEDSGRLPGKLPGNIDLLQLVETRMQQWQQQLQQQLQEQQQIMMQQMQQQLQMMFTQHGIGTKAQIQ